MSRSHEENQDIKQADKPPNTLIAFFHFYVVQTLADLTENLTEIKFRAYPLDRVDK